MPTFRGFPDDISSKRSEALPQGKVRLTPLPGPFFSELLPEIHHLGELKLILYVFWRLDQMEGTFRGLRRKDFAGDALFMQGLDRDPARAEALLDEALEGAVQRGTLLSTSFPGASERFREGGIRTPGGSAPKTALDMERIAMHGANASGGKDMPEQIYFLNSPRGRAAVEAVQKGSWKPSEDLQVPVELGLDRPNIFQLYEEHIGPLTPMIADTLREAESTYPGPWIEDAIRIAVELNKRSWRYVEAILRRWREEGRDERKDRRDTEKNRFRYAEEWRSSDR